MADTSLGFNLLGRDVSASKALKQVGAEARNTQSAFSRMGEIAGGVLGANLLSNALQGVRDFAVGSINAASDLAESQSKIDVVFGKSASVVSKWAQDSATSFGMSSQAALEAAGTYGNLFQSFGLGQQEAQKMSTSLVQLASDLASFNNTSTEDALQALRSGLSGETEPLKAFGIAINDTRLKQEALNLGIYNGVGVLDVAQKSQAAYALIMKDSALAQGDFARTSDGLANQQRILEGQVQNLQAALGQVFIPVVLGGVSALNSIIGATLSFRLNLDAMRPVLIAAAVALGVVTTGYLIQNAALLALYGQYYAYIARLALVNAAHYVAAAATSVFSAGLVALRLALTLALGPIGVLITVVGGLTYAFSQMGPTAQTTATRFASVTDAAGKTSKVLAQTLPPSAGKASNAMYAFQKSQEAVTGSSGPTKKALNDIEFRYVQLARAAMVAARAQEIAARQVSAQSAATSRWVGLAESLGKNANAVGYFGGGNLDEWRASLNDAGAALDTFGGGGSGGAGGATEKVVTLTAAMRAALSSVSSMSRGVQALSTDLGSSLIDRFASGIKAAGRITQQTSTDLTALVSVIRDKVNAALQAGQQRLDAAKAAFEGYRDSIAAGITQGNDLSDAVSAQADAQKALADALKQQADARAALTRAEASGNDATTARDTLAAADAAVADARAKQGSFLDFLQLGADAAAGFAGQINALRSAGASLEVVQKIAALGAQTGGRIVTELLSGGRDAIEKANRLVNTVVAVGQAAGVAAAQQFFGAGIAAGQAFVDALNQQIQDVIQPALDRLATMISNAIGQKIDASIAGSPAVSLSEGMSAPFDRTATNDLWQQWAQESGVADWVASLPKMANGGIVTSPTIAMIGERGPEAVVPLSRAQGQPIVVNVYPQGNVVTERDLAVTIRDEMAQMMRRRGLDPAVIGV